MTEALLDSLPVASLPDRYSISRSVLYDRIKALNVEPEKRGNKSYVNAHQLELLDSLHAFLNSGGSTADFLASTGLSAEQSDEDGLQSGGQLVAMEQVGAIAILVEAIAQRLPPFPPPDPLTNLEALERAAQNGWLLSTSQLAPLLRLKTLSGKELQRYGFTFTRVGKNGAESAWSVSKAPTKQLLGSK